MISLLKIRYIHSKELLEFRFNFNFTKNLRAMFLRQLKNKGEVDEVIQTVEEKVLVLRFGKDDEIGCMQTDDIVRY